VLAAGADFDPDGSADKAEGLTDLVLEESLIGKMELHVAIGEEDERRRRNGGLGEIEDPHTLAHGDGGAIEVDSFQEAVHFAGCDPLAAFGGDFLKKRKNLIDIFASRSRDEERGCIVQKFE